MDALRNAHLEQLLSIKEVGHSIAHSLREFFTDEHEMAMLEALNNAGLQCSIDESEMQLKTDEFAGYSIVLTGELIAMTRKEASEEIEKRGGKVTEDLNLKMH